jgi:trimeric autotransporter adhesin
MRRFLAFAVLFLCSLPAGLSIAGCGHNPNNYCVNNGHAYGIKTTQVVAVALQPEATGLSLAWGQTGQVGPATAYNCTGGTESVTKYIYSSSNLQLGDISPAGTVCAGTWNRNSPGGVPNFTICTPPAGSSLSSFVGCTSGTCGTVQVTATGAAVTSNPVNVYIHPPITSMTIPQQTACISQGQTLSASLLSQTTVTGPGGVTLCSPSTISCTSPNASVGTITYSPVTASVVTINNTTEPANPNPITGGSSSISPNPNGIATANLAGSTVVNASAAQVTSAAGYFSTCPPKTIALSINGNNTSATVTPSSVQTVVANVTDNNTPPATLNGLQLTFTSTEPQNLTVTSTGSITNTFPSHATIAAICQPPTCNPAPVNLIGLLGNGMPVTGNTITVDAPGRSSNQIWMGSSQSPYFSEVDLTTGGVAAPIRLPYTPNSMVMDANGDSLFFGSYHELMIYHTLGNTLSKEVPGVPGVVLAVSPSGATALINDQLRQVLYLYNVSGGVIATSIAGIANRAQFSADGNTVYVVGQDPATGLNTLFVNNSSTGWSTYTLTSEPTYACPLEAAGTAEVPAYNPAYDPFCGAGVGITVPNVAAFLTGNATVAHSFCPNSSASPPYYPPAADVSATTTQLVATADGNHILGADTTTLTDIGLFQDTGFKTPGLLPGACPAYSGPALALNTNFTQAALPAGVTPSEIDQVVSSPDSSIAFITYNVATGQTATGVLPYYLTAAPGTVNSVTLSGGAAAGAPVAGVFSPDGTIFFVSTSADTLVHMVGTTSTPPADTQTIDPKLTDGNGNAVPAQFLAVKSRSTT